LAKTAGADEKKILTAIGTDSRIGNKYLQYGFGFGGPCFPRDNRALQQYAEQINIKLPLSVATDEINNDHLRFQLKEWMNNYSPDEEIVFEGVSYKNGSPLIEESQQLKLAVALAKNNRKVIIVDNKNVIEQVRNQFGDLFIYKIRA
jgi:UDPglucose 6-dehydrogenase